MNNIQEMDWAEDCWHGHTGMDSSSEYCSLGDAIEEQPADGSEQETSADPAMDKK